MNWPRRALGEIVSFKGGGTPRKDIPEYWSGDIPWATVKDFKSLCLDRTMQSISAHGLESSAANLIPTGHVIIPTRMGLGKAAINSIDVAINQDLRALLPQTGIDSRYLLWVMLSLAPEIERNGSGATVKGITQARLAKLELPLPPLAEQKRIARILDAADALRARRRKTLDQLDALLQSTFLDLFGDPVTNPKGWKKNSLAQLTATKPNNGIFRKNAEYSSDGTGLPVVWVEDLFKNNRIDTSGCRRLVVMGQEIEKYGLRKGDVLFCRSSLKLDGIGYNNVFLGETGSAMFECHLIRLSPDTALVDAMFLNQQLRSVPMRALVKSKSKTATMTTIDQKALLSIDVVVPPLERQQRFATIVEAVEQQKARLRAHLAELDTLCAALQARAFNGEL